MSDIQAELRKAAAELLDQGKVDVVIGFREGARPLSASPCFIKEAERADDLVWNPFCSVNLAAYLPRFFTPDPRLKEPPPPPKVAIISKGCDGRSIVGLVKERKVPRDNVVIVAVPCHGVVDAGAVRQRLGGAEIADAKMSGDTIKVTGELGKKHSIELAEVLSDVCRECAVRTAPVRDILVGEVQDEPSGTAGNGNGRLASLSSAERWQLFRREMSKCIRCCACRQACPNCYCKDCFAELSRPRWLGAGDNVENVMFFHLGRMIHQAGRCVDCGACVRACPQGCDLRPFTHKLVRDAKELFGFEAGLDLDTPPPLTVFKPEDPEDFITEPE
jgi:ferredoxin